MSTDHRGPALFERPGLLLALSSVGFLGCASLIGGTLLAQMFVPDHDWVSDTISDLAAGPWELVMDMALYGFAAGILATALAASHAHLGKAGWSIGVVSLAVLAALVIVVGARNEYGDSDSEGVPIHIYLVYGLGLFFFIVPVSMAKGIGEDHGWARRLLIALSIIWGIASPIFFLLPTNIDGLYERGLGIVACAIISTICAVFWARSRATRQSA